MQLHPHYYEDLPDYTPDPYAYTCTECGEVCCALVEDQGIGVYDYAGSPGVDTRLVARSNCCEADVVPKNK